MSSVRTRWRSITSAVLRVAIGLLCFGGLFGTTIGWASPALASSGGEVVIYTPRSASGPVDTLVTIDLNVMVSAPTTYTLSATKTSPSQNGCASAVPISGAPTISATPDSGAASAGLRAQFRWPASLPRGKYWLCATPGPASGQPTISSYQPFTALSDARPAVHILSPQPPVVAGTDLSITASNWFVSDNATPQVALLRQGSASSTFTGVVVYNLPDQSTPAAGTYAQRVSVLSFVGAGTYALVLLGECDQLNASGPPACAVSEQTDYFAVTAAPTPTAGPTSVPTPSTSVTAPSARSTTAGDIVVVLLAGALLVLVAWLVARILLRRSRARSAGPSGSQGDEPRWW